MLCLLLYLYLLAIVASVVLSWFPLNPNGSMATVAGFLCTVTDPVMKRVRRMLPAARFGGAALDFSPVVVFFGILIALKMLTTFGLC